MLAAGLFGFVPAVWADDWASARPDAHAPIGVMGDHTHKRGEWMLSYRFMRSHMDGLRDGTDSVSKQEVYASEAAGGYGYHNAPLDMDMSMHMVEAMYAPSDRLTLMVMGSYQEMDMTMELHRHGDHPPLRYEMHTEGIGDVTVSGLYLLTPDQHRHRWIAIFGLSLPTGSIDEKEQMPHGPGGSSMNMRVEYPMQLGSGTVDLKPGLTYFGQAADWSWGAQAIATIRTGENDRDWRLGHRADATAWAAYRWAPSVSTSLRLIGAAWGDVHGQDDDIEPDMSPLADPDALSGERVDAAIGVNFYVPSGTLRGHRLGIEAMVPLHERFDGPQLETDWAVTAGWQYAF